MKSVWVQFVLIFAQPTQCSSVCHLRQPSDHRQQHVTEPEVMPLPLNHLPWARAVGTVCGLVQPETITINRLRVNLESIDHKKVSPFFFLGRQFLKVGTFHNLKDVAMSLQVSGVLLNFGRNDILQELGRKIWISQAFCEIASKNWQDFAKIFAKQG